MKNIYYPIPGHAGVSFGFYGTRGKGFYGKDETFLEGPNNRLLVAEIVDHIGPVEPNTGSIFDVPVRTKVNYFKRLTKLWKPKNRRPVIIECHTNAAGNGRENHPANGLVVWCDKSEESRRLAAIVSKNLFATGLWGTQRGVKVSGWWKGKFLRKLGMVLGTPCPSIIIEFGFHTNKLDRAMIQKWQNKEIIGKVMGESVKEFEESQND